MSITSYLQLCSTCKACTVDFCDCLYFATIFLTFQDLFLNCWKIRSGFLKSYLWNKTSWRGFTKTNVQNYQRDSPKVSRKFVERNISYLQLCYTCKSCTIDFCDCLYFATIFLTFQDLFLNCWRIWSGFLKSYLRNKATWRGFTKN